MWINVVPRLVCLKTQDEIHALNCLEVFVYFLSLCTVPKT